MKAKNQDENQCKCLQINRKLTIIFINTNFCVKHIVKFIKLRSLHVNFFIGFMEN